VNLSALPTTLGRYHLVRELGRGAMGAVYLAQDPAQPEQQVALKTLALGQDYQGSNLTEARKRFFREAYIASRLRHPDIVTIFDAHEDTQQQLAYIAMEYLPGHNLQQCTRQLLPVATVLTLVHRVALALSYAHSQGVVHRDIKPANIMVDFATQRVKITDFGIAHVHDTVRTMTGLVMGTPSYMAPEQLTGAQCDGRSDVYALGVVLYELLCGHLPHQDSNMASLMRDIATARAPDILLRRPELGEPLSKLVGKALEKRPERRFSSGEKMATALHTML
jgi:eukaryotic-like serine/threonine-protein kinase